jgi:GGDEF domain-containing protein
MIKAGAWHLFSSPLDTDEVRLRIERFAAVRRNGHRAAEMSLIDADSGLYNAAGLARRGRELGQQAMRQHWAMSCVVLSAEVADAESAGVAETRCAAVLRHVGRLSDVMGRLGQMEYLALAPATDARGAEAFARRLAIALHETLQQSLPGSSVRLKVGFSSTPNLGYQPVEPTELLARAAIALRGGAAHDFAWIPPSDLAHHAVH